MSEWLSGEWRGSEYPLPYSLLAIHCSLSKNNNKDTSAMRVLVVGAGAIGGYFGGRLLQAGRDVTFLVRPKRASELATAGLVIKSPAGDVTLKNPPTVQADKLTEKFDVVLLSCKAFDLEDAIKSFAPAVGPKTAIIPLAQRHAAPRRCSTRNLEPSACSAASARSR